MSTDAFNMATGFAIFFPAIAVPVLRVPNLNNKYKHLCMYPVTPDRLENVSSESDRKHKFDWKMSINGLNYLAQILHTKWDERTKVIK